MHLHPPVVLYLYVANVRKPDNVLIILIGSVQTCLSGLLTPAEIESSHFPAFHF